MASVGIVIPSLLGFGVARLFYPNESGFGHLFTGAILCATSVGITARVLKHLGRMNTREAKLILGAAVMDDVLGLLVLATVAAMIRGAAAGAPIATLDVLLIVVKALGFLVGAMVLGRPLVRAAFRLAAGLTGRGVLLTLSLSLCFFLAYLAGLAGLAPIIGAFTGGLIPEASDLDRVVAREQHSLEELLHPVSALFLPVFFFLMGLKVDLGAFGQPGVLLFAGALTLVALLGKLACGLVVPGRSADRWLVAIGMVPRGEVGLIFAAIGLTLTVDGHPVLHPAAYSAVVLMVMATTLLTPVLLKARLSRARPS